MEIEFYDDHRGEEPVKEYIDSLTHRTEINQVVAYIRELRTQGHKLRRPLAAPLRDDIYELRPGPNRILYGFSGGKAVLLHALRKTRNEIPDRDIDLAVKRLEEWRGR